MNDTINTTISTIINQTPAFLGITAPITQSPIIDIYIITLITSLFITLVNKHMSDQETIKKTRKELKSLQKEMREVMKKDPKKAQTIQQQIMKKNLENMKHAFNIKIMMITMIPLSLVFILIRQLYSPFGEFFNFFGITTFGWLGTYIVFSIINSMILKKALDVA